MEDKKQAEKKRKNLFKELYLGNATVITICWIVASLHLTMVYKYKSCINCYDEKNTFIFILWCSIIIIFIVYFIIITYFFINRKKIGKKIDDKIEENHGYFGFAELNPKVFILPMYLLWIFSLSKLIVIFYQYYYKGSSENIIIKIVILLVIFIGSFWAWISFKKTSTKVYSFWITVFAISYILINVFWEYFLPYLKSYFSTINCIFKTIITI